MDWQKVVMSMPMVEVLDGSFKMIRKYYSDRDNRKELKGIKPSLERLDGANIFDIFAESEN